jgi:hypothetical protein
MAGGKQVSPAVAVTIIVIVIIVIVAIYMRTGGAKHVDVDDDTAGVPPYAQKGLRITPNPSGSLPPQAPSGGQ